MSKKCSICCQPFFQNQKIVRITVEAVSKGKGEGDDSDYWTTVHDWEVVTKYHLACVRKNLDKGINFTYEDEVALLPIDQLYEQHIGTGVPYLKVVEGGKK